MARDVLAGMVLDGGGRVSVASVRGSAPVTTDTTSSELAWPRVGAVSPAAVGSLVSRVPPSSPGLASDTGVSASYDGGADPDSGTDVGLGVDGVSSLFLSWLSAL